MHNLLITQDRPEGPRKKVRRFYPEIMVREKLFSWKSTALKAFEKELKEFIKMCNGEKEVQMADGIAGLRAIEVADAVKESTRTGEAINLDIPTL